MVADHGIFVTAAVCNEFSMKSRSDMQLAESKTQEEGKDGRKGKGVNDKTEKEKNERAADD